MTLMDYLGTEVYWVWVWKEMVNCHDKARNRESGLQSQLTMGDYRSGVDDLDIR